MTDLIPLFAIVFTIGLPMVAVIVWIVLNYRKRRRLMELHHAERMAAIERGMDIPPLPLELIDGRSPRRRTELLPGLVWFFIGLAMTSGALFMEDDVPIFGPIVGGLIPMGVGLAYLIYYFVEVRNKNVTASRPNDAPAPGARVL